MNPVPPAAASAAPSQGNFQNPPSGTACAKALKVMDEVLGDVNPYDILAPCVFKHHDNSNTQQQQQQQQEVGRSWPHAPIFPKNAPVTNWWQKQQKMSPPTTSSSSSGSRRGLAPGMLGHTIPCADRSHALLYYNTPKVREAIHAAPLKASGRWEPCSDVLHYRNSPESLVGVHRELLDAGLHGLIFSGDHDYVVPYTGTRDWVWSMNLPVERGWEWGAWYMGAGSQVGGYAVRFEKGLTFATVKGAGHMVPQTAPEAALKLLQLWLQRKL